jgi:MYXO-CTERM domain-containing protein
MRWLIVLFVGLASLSQTSEARACSCMKLSPAEGLSSSYAVFTGKVTKVERNESTKFGGLSVTLQVGKVWKGDVGEEVEVHTAGNSAACGYSFAKGETYLVYASRDEADPMRVSLCSRTALVSNADEDLEFLGEPAKQFDDASTKRKSKHGAANTKDNCSASPGPPGGASLVWAMLLLAGLFVTLRRHIRLA